MSYDHWKTDNEPIRDEECPICGTLEYIALGFLGNREHRRCRACGMDYSLEVQI